MQKLQDAALLLDTHKPRPSHKNGGLARLVEMYIARTQANVVGVYKSV